MLPRELIWEEVAPPHKGMTQWMAWAGVVLAIVKYLWCNEKFVEGHYKNETFTILNCSQQSSITQLPLMAAYAKNEYTVHSHLYIICTQVTAIQSQFTLAHSELSNECTIFNSKFI